MNGVGFLGFLSLAFGGIAWAKKSHDSRVMVTRTRQLAAANRARAQAAALATQRRVAPAQQQQPGVARRDWLEFQNGPTLV